MKKYNQGLSTVGIIVIILIIIAGGGYYYLSNKNIKDSIPVIESDSDVSQSASNIGERNIPVNNSRSKQPNLDCHQFLTENEIINSFALSNKAKITFESDDETTYASAGCIISWEDFSATNKSGGSIWVNKYVDESTAKITFSFGSYCGGKPTAGLGDESCINSTSKGELVGISFRKGIYGVAIITDESTNKLIVLGKILIGKFN